MVFLILISATTLAALWLFLLFHVNQDDWVAAAYARVETTASRRSGSGSGTRSGRSSWPATTA